MHPISSDKLQVLSNSPLSTRVSSCSQVILLHLSVWDEITYPFLKKLQRYNRVWLCKAGVSLLLTQWRYPSLVLSHRDNRPTRFRLYVRRPFPVLRGKFLWGGVEQGCMLPDMSELLHYNDQLGNYVHCIRYIIYTFHSDNGRNNSLGRHS